MKIHTMKCVNCSASLDVDIDNLIAFCPYCGQKLLFDVQQLSEILKEREHTKQVFKHEDEVTRRAQMQHDEKITNISIKAKSIFLVILAWIVSIIVLAVMSMFTLDAVNFSPYQLILILDIIGGIVVLKNWVKK